MAKFSLQHVRACCCYWNACTFNMTHVHAAFSHFLFILYSTRSDYGTLLTCSSIQNLVWLRNYSKLITKHRCTIHIQFVLQFLYFFSLDDVFIVRSIFNVYYHIRKCHCAFSILQSQYAVHIQACIYIPMSLIGVFPPAITVTQLRRMYVRNRLKTDMVKYKEVLLLLPISKTFWRFQWDISMYVY